MFCACIRKLMKRRSLWGSLKVNCWVWRCFTSLCCHTPYITNPIHSPTRETDANATRWQKIQKQMKNKMLSLSLNGSTVTSWLLTHGLGAFGGLVRTSLPRKLTRGHSLPARFMRGQCSSSAWNSPISDATRRKSNLSDLTPKRWRRLSNDHQ